MLLLVLMNLSLHTVTIAGLGGLCNIEWPSSFPA